MSTFPVITNLLAEKRSSKDKNVSVCLAVLLLSIENWKNTKFAFFKKYDTNT